MKSLDPSETREWWLNQRVANYVQEAAKQYEGFGVLRTDDVTGAEDVRLSTRCAAANSYGANLYLSLHHNAGINGGRGGGVVSLRARGPAKQVGGTNAKGNDRVFRRSMEKHGGGCK